MYSKLPPELVGLIAKFSYGDKKTLASASRVSRTWLVAFHKLLFETICIQVYAAEELEEAFGFLEKSTAVCPLIIQLHLTGEIDAYVLANILSLLPRLSTLSLAGNFSVPSGPLNSFAPLHLDSLSIAWRMHYRSFGSDSGHSSEDTADTSVANEQFRGEAQILVNIFRLFSQVRKLWFQYMMERGVWNLTPFDLQEIIPIPGTLRAESFCLETDRATNSMMGFFSRLVDPQALYSFATSADWYPDFEEFRSLVREASNLSSLSFKVDECLTDVSPNLSLKECPSLRSLLIHPEFATALDETEPEVEGDHDSGQRAIFGWDAVEMVLFQRISQIHHITIEIERYALPPHQILQSFEYIPWPQLQMLILDHYPNLETLNFSFYLRKQYRDRGVSYEDLRAYVLKNLPHLAARDMVEFKKVEVFYDDLSWSYDLLPLWMQ